MTLVDHSATEKPVSRIRSGRRVSSLRNFNRFRHRQTFPEVVLQPFHLADLGSREKVNLLRIEFDPPHPAILTGNPILLLDLSHAEFPGRDWVDPAIAGIEVEEFGFGEIDANPVFLAVQIDADIVPLGKFFDRHLAGVG
ncbi:MAG: hypothetical protein JNK93_16405, partial [Planctomycetia bacterium]|nr:hypothetical protein [Planctomycetia bacterium]